MKRVLKVLLIFLIGPLNILLGQWGGRANAHSCWRASDGFGQFGAAFCSSPGCPKAQDHGWLVSHDR